MDEVEDQIVRAVLTAPGVRRPPNTRRTSSQERPFPAAKRQKHRFSRPRGLMDASSASLKMETLSDGDDDRRRFGDNRDMVYFENLNSHDLDVFSKNGKAVWEDLIGYMVSLGLTFVHQLVHADADRRKDLIRENSPTWRDFLPEALEHRPQTGPDTIIPSLPTDNWPSEPNLGYYLYKRSEKELYSTIYHEGIMNSPLRERAFFFWDTERILFSEVNDSLQSAKYMDPTKVRLLFSRRERRSAEEWLGGFRMPRKEMDRIRGEFSSRWDPRD